MLSAEGVVRCPRNHENPQGAAQCQVCQSPIVHFREEMELVLKQLTDKAVYFKTRVEKGFIGVGTVGQRLVQHFYQLYGIDLPRSAFLTVDTGARSPGVSAPPGAPTIAAHRVGRGMSESAVYCGLGYDMAAKDPELGRRLVEMGIREPDERQGVFLVSTLGGGTGSGVSPYLVNRVREINPAAATFAIAITPFGDETDRVHFNALYGISRLLSSQGRPLVDVLCILSYDRLKRIKGVGRAGEEMGMESLLCAFLALMALEPVQIGIIPLKRMSNALATQVFVPCLAMGRSMEIFGSLTNVLESALAYPLAPLDHGGVIASCLFLRVPSRCSRDLPENLVGEEFDRWNRTRFPRIKASLFRIFSSEEASDRLDACILLGGDSLHNAMGVTEQGYQRFKAFVEGSGQWQSCGLTQAEVSAAEKAVAHYDAMRAST